MLNRLYRPLVWSVLFPVLISTQSQAASSPSDELLCWKQSFGRGVGGIGTDCPAGQVKENGLCYKTCPSGYVGNGPLCWQSCPAGYTDMGVSCTKPAPTSSAGYAWQFGDTAFSLDGARARCDRDNPGVGCYTSGAIVYPKCKTGFHKVGDLVCSPDCINGMRDDGAFCAKQTQGRDAGTIPACGAGMDTDAGLCYPSCGQGFGGVGPVCWGTCPADFPTQCGAACAKSSGACAMAVGDMVLSTAGVAINILSVVAGGPGITAAAKAAASAGTKAAAMSVVKTSTSLVPELASTMVKTYAKTCAKTFIKETLKNQLLPKNINIYWTVAGLVKTGGLKAMNKAATEFGVLKESDTFDFTSLDPTGIASMVNSFAKYGSCSGDDFLVDNRELDFGVTGTGLKTVKITAQQPMTITRITSPAFSNCSITPDADCIGKQLSPGQTCDIKVDLKSQGPLDSELRIYTSAYTTIPYPIHIKSEAPTGSCTEVPNVEEAVNLTSITGAWAFDSDQSHKVVVQSNGTVQGWTGNGTVTVKNAAARQFEFRFGSFGPATLTLGDLNDQLTGVGSPAIKRPWDARCDAGQVLFAGLCYDVPPGYAMTTPGFMGKPCLSGWRDDGTSCYPAWTGVTVPAQADKDGIFTMQHPIIVTDCADFSHAKGQSCPKNFADTGGPAGCSCQAQPTSKEVKSIIGKVPPH